MALGEGIEALAFIPLASSCELIGKFMAAEDLHVLLRKAIGTKRWLWRLSRPASCMPSSVSVGSPSPLSLLHLEELDGRYA